MDFLQHFFKKYLIFKELNNFSIIILILSTNPLSHVLYLNLYMSYLEHFLDIECKHWGKKIKTNHNYWDITLDPLIRIKYQLTINIIRIQHVKPFIKFYFRILFTVVFMISLLKTVIKNYCTIKTFTLLKIEFFVWESIKTNINFHIYQTVRLGLILPKVWRIFWVKEEDGWMEVFSHSKK